MKSKNSKKIDEGLKLLVKSSVIVLIAFFLSKIFGYLYRIIIARYFGPEVYGLFSLSTAIIGGFVLFSLLGFDEGIIRYFSFYRGKNEINKMRYLFKFSSEILFFSTLIITLIFFLSSDFIAISIFRNPDLIIFLKLFIFVIPFWVFASFFLSIMRAFEKIKEISIIDSIINPFLKVVSLILLIILFGFNNNAVILSFMFGFLVISLSTFFYCKFKIPKIFLKYNLNIKTKKKITKDFISYSWPFLFFGIFSIFYYWTDSFVIGFFKSVTEVGFYNAITPIALLLNIIPAIFLQLFFPLITKEYSLKNFNLIKEISKQIGKWIFMFNFPFFLLVILFPEIIINILFGPQYLVAANSLRFLVIGALFASVFVISNNLISMVGKSRIILYDVIIVTVLDMTLNILLIPKPIIFGLDNSLGINGAAIATMTSVITCNILFFIQAKHYTSITPLKLSMFKIFLASLIPFFILLILSKLIFINLLSFILLTILFLLIYLFLLFLFKAFDEEDVMIFRTIKRKIKNDILSKK
ncbi:flippase [Candidatus Pacearchaeota archaeon]|nr:flippase [Candidatus Pacearchaeota archaeon]